MPDWATQRLTFATELREHPAITGFNSAEDLVKEHINLQGMIGRKGIIPPKDDDIHDVKRYLTAVGRPDEVSGYGDVYVDTEDAEMIGWDDELRGGLDLDMFDSGITDASRAILLPKTVARFKARQQEWIQGNQAAAEEDLAGLKLKHGSAYESKMNAGRRALQAIFGEDAKTLQEMPMADGVILGNHLEWIEGLIRMGEQHHVDDTLVDASGRPVQGPMNPAAAKLEIERLEGDKHFMGMYLDDKDIGHKAANKQMENLYKMAWPPGQV
jgi:hypothetical protein